MTNPDNACPLPCPSCGWLDSNIAIHSTDAFDDGTGICCTACGLMVVASKGAKALAVWNAASTAALRAGLSPAARDVLAERRRQVEVEGFTAEHDGTHVFGALATAGACYALYSAGAAILVDGTPEYWPHTTKSWKPSGAYDDLPARRRDLVKAGALILAEIERLDRTMPAAGGGDGGC